MTFLALCAVGAEKTLANELKKLSAASNAVYTIHGARVGCVRAETDLFGLYIALWGLCCADRVLLECGRFPARDFDELFEGVKSAPLEEYVPRESALVVEKVRLHKSRLAAETSVQAVVHKAAAARLCEKRGVLRLPEDGAPVRLRLYLEQDEAALALDLSGAPLFKRGWRVESGAAPLRETAAATVLRASGWKRKHPLYDPYCGAGTIVLEAALYAWNAAPGLSRRFALDGLLLADAALESRTRAFFSDALDLSRPVRLMGSDRDNALVTAASRNAQRFTAALGRAAGRTETEISRASDALRFVTVDALRARSFDEDGFLVTNPPYGKRLGTVEDAERNYALMAQLRGGFPGWRLVVLSDHEGFESHFGRKAGKCRLLSVGALKLYCFEFGKCEEKPAQRPERTEQAERPQKTEKEEKRERALPGKRAVEKAPQKKYTWTW
jgi:putative N6-adenine-specific DNA methylase